MRDEAEIMEEIHALDRQIKNFPPTAHWFCPRRNDDDPVDYDKPDEQDEEMSMEEKKQMIEDAKKRHDVAYKLSIIVGLDQQSSGDMLSEYTEKLNRTLKACDKCVRNWHMGRKAYLKELSEQLDEEIVVALANRLNSLDFDRLDKGLATAEKILRDAPEDKRSSGLLASMDSNALMALYEALCSADFHKSEANLTAHFNYVFEQVQNRKVLRLGDLLPAMAHFLFDPNPKRLSFAQNAWLKTKDRLSTETFEWVVHDALSEAILIVSQPLADITSVLNFWTGFLLLLGKMDEDLITHSLRAMEVQPSIYQLLVQSLRSSSEEVVALVVEAFRALLQKSPNVFWSAMGTISPVTVAEQIFASKGFETGLTRIDGNFDQAETSPVISWIPDFIASLPAIHQYDACRSLLYHLFERLQDDRFPEPARLACCRAGLIALSTTLTTFLRSDYKINPSTSLIVINNVMGLVDQYKDTIMGCAALDADNGSRRDLKRLGMIVIRDALALDCQAMSAEFQALVDEVPIHRVQRVHSQAVWQSVLDIFRPGNLELAKSILIATTVLAGMDEILPRNRKNVAAMPVDHVQFNQDYKQLNDSISRVFERLSEFNPSDLRQLYQSPQTARPLFSALVSADQATYEAAVEVIKAMTEESGKQEAMKRLLEDAFSPFLTSITYAVSRIHKNRTFAPVPYMLKIGKDVLDTLCGSTGVLRNRSALNASEQNALLGWWSHQWNAVDVIFLTFETWSARVSRTVEYQEELIRDAMEYSNALFDAHSVLATVVRVGGPAVDDKTVLKSSSNESVRKVLDVVCHRVYGLTLMLRLKDQYLISIIARLLVKLLHSLEEYNLEIDEDASNYIKDACKQEKEKNFRKTNLSSTQKAELQRALEQHQGIELIEVPAQNFTATKQSTIDSWSRAADGVRHEPKFAVPPRKSSDLPGSSSHHKSKLSALESMKSRPVGRASQIAALAKPNGKQIIEQRRKLEEEKKRRDADAIATAKALRGGLVKGEGSGLQSIGGIAGKDHAPIRSEIMVGSSDEDSDSDEDDEDDGTNTLLVRGKSKQVTEYEESRKRALPAIHQGPVRKTKIQRSAKDLRARVEPNMDKLYLEILNWDIFHNSDAPPSKLEYTRIEKRYLDLDRYKRTFGPLLLSEVWRSLVTAKEELAKTKAVDIKVLNRLSVDKFMEISTSMPLPSKESKVRMAERDIVLLSRSADPLNNPQEPHCLARIDRTTRKRDVLEITYRVSREISPQFLQCLVPNGKIMALKITDMTTTQREFAALSSLEYYDLCSEIMEAKPSPIQKYGDEKLANIATRYTLNKGQAHAILCANDNDGFTLIQGPPGSGKTKTIVAMVGAILTASLQQEREEQQRAAPQVQRPTTTAAKPASTAPKKKLLICAPSNNAVDEIVARIKDGILPLNGSKQKINVIRIGRSDAIGDNVKDVMLDELVRIKLEGTQGEKDKLVKDRDDMHKEAKDCKDRLAVIRPALDAARAANNKAEELKLQREFDDVKRKQNRVNNRIDEDKESGTTIARMNEINRRKFQQEILDGAHVICATLSGSGHDMFRNLNVEFETVIIDEAAQCIELSALIPLKYGCSKCILVGDPNQLPPTVLSRSAQSFGYEQSLFVRMQANHPKDVHLLDTQYRMHPEISAFPSQYFYDSKLVDGADMAQLRQQPWHASSVLSPYRFFHVDGVQTRDGKSQINQAEIDAAIALYSRLKSDFRNYNFKGKIGIISTYKGQYIAMERSFRARYGDAIFDDIEFNTTDAFQGREREIIIFSCVRAHATGGIGFLTDIRRMNVGLTRAKSSLWVLGDSNALIQGEYWNKLIQDAKTRQRFTANNVMALFSKPTSRDAPRYAAPATVKSLPDRLKDEDQDVDMIDAPGTPDTATTSRKESPVDSGTESGGTTTSHTAVKRELKKSSLGEINVPKPRKPVVAASAGMAGLGIQQGKQQSKRPAEAMEKDSKKVKTAASDLEAAYLAREAAKSAPTPRQGPPPPPPPGGPPRKKAAPNDPFIQRKKPQRRA